METQAKLKAALADRVAAIADKANLERAMKQSKSQALTLEKTLEKNTAVENKKRESILVVGGLSHILVAYIIHRVKDHTGKCHAHKQRRPMYTIRRVPQCVVHVCSGRFEYQSMGEQTACFSPIVR